PALLSDLFKSSSNPGMDACMNNDDGDPIVLYDPIADRWLLSQFVYGFPSHECIAISQTGDPTGAYFLYDFLNPDPLKLFGDYPKLAVWPDAYYLTVNSFAPLNFDSVGIFALNRTQMINGSNSVDFQYFKLPNQFGVLPADLDGSSLPPAGSPEY